MPTEVLPFVNALQSGDEELAGASPQALNVTVDGAGAVRRRPGIAAYFDESPPSVEGARALHVAEDGQTFAIWPRSSSSPLVLDVYRVLPAAHDLIGSMVATARPIIAETEMLLVVAAGEAVRKIELASPITMSDLGGSPPQATHVCHNSLRLLANDISVDRTKIRYSSQAQGTTTYAGHEEWSVGTGTAGFFTAEASPDPLVANAENTNEVWGFGTKTLQVFAPDATLVFAPLVTLEVGCAAPYSIVKKEGMFYWLDHARRFVASNGRGTEVLSKGLQSVIQGFSRVDDCFGYRVLLGPVDAVVWTFPTEGRTFCLQDGGGWAEWTSWDAQTSQPRPFAITSHSFDQNEGQNLVGLPIHGIGVLRRGLASDIGSYAPVEGEEPEDEPILAEVTTGFLSRGTDARKHCKRIRLTFRRGDSARTPEVRGYITYRDSIGPWEPPFPVVLDGMQPVCEISSLGTYRRRQWKYTFSDADEDLVLAGAEEDFEVTD